MALQFRPYQATDFQACLEAFKSNVPQFFSDQEVLDFESFLNTNALFQGPENDKLNPNYHVVLSGNMIVGCGGFGYRLDSDEITLIWGLIHRDFHRQGFGREFLKFRLDKLHEIYPGRPVLIDTTQFSAPFFEKYGFERISRTDDYYSPGLHRIDMKLNL